MRLISVFREFNPGPESKQQAEPPTFGTVFIIAPFGALIFSLIAYFVIKHLGAHLPSLWAILVFVLSYYIVFRLHWWHDEYDAAKRIKKILER